MSLPRSMTITKIEAVVLVGRRPRVIGRNARLGVHGQFVREPIVRLHTDAGIVGWGRSAATEEDAHELIGKRLHEVWNKATGTSASTLRFDMPLWDLGGRVLGQSFYQMLGDEGSSPVPIYDGSIYIEELDPETGRDDGLEPMLQAARLGLDAGLLAFKIKVGRGFRWMDRKAGLQRDVDVIHGIRDLVGPNATLMIDANNGYTPSEAREVMVLAGDCDIYWFEEPFPEDVEESVGFRRFMRDGGWGTLLADGEGHHGYSASFTDVLRAGGVDVVQFDFRSYGLSAFLQYLPEIQKAGAEAAPHNWASHLLGFYIQQFGRGCRNFAMAETDPMNMPAVISSGYELVNGMMNVPDTPGFGLELDLGAFTVAQQEDGAWTVA